VGSENTSSADNQQETRHSDAINPGWLTGFVDGEGCFGVRVIENANATRSGGYTFGFVFSITQHYRAKNTLEDIACFFQCGSIVRKSPNSNVWVYTVTSTKNIEARILPFFDQNRLVVKTEDYEKFRILVTMFRRKEHFLETEFYKMVHLTYQMNSQGVLRKHPVESILWKGSSETIRQARDVRRVMR